ncbi:GntR family transcriptional regulator [Cohnella abietis]|uniref:HTH gntR-type domain-containing protein n=1 Tax=Cohnella abietis TaxID=2507935 RepID=A0A3T1D4B9_9BACL|nr:GntR family transcriptional regulator [Cohnella abietis]BBI32953.1 hypothetical protein KCTCHS21_23520 [Cohnella abietis]
MGNPSLRQQAYEIIHQWIVNGDFPKGTVTSEVQISQKLDMSRTPIRAALQQLELEGYVRIASKHGVIILDSSSQRVSDLLDVVISMVLFSISTSWESKREDLHHMTASMSEAFQALMLKADREESGGFINEFIAFEFELLGQFIRLSSNEEMIKTYHSATSRLFWNHNVRRWQAPFAGETTEQVKNLIHSLSLDIESFREALFLYLHTLKRTWL